MDLFILILWVLIAPVSLSRFKIKQEIPMPSRPKKKNRTRYNYTDNRFPYEYKPQIIFPSHLNDINKTQNNIERFAYIINNNEIQTVTTETSGSKFIFDWGPLRKALKERCATFKKSYFHSFESGIIYTHIPKSGGTSILGIS